MPPQCPDSRRTRALILAAHGSHWNADSSAPAHQQAAALRQRNIFDEVVVVFWKEEPNLRHALNLVESDDVFIVPFFISNGYFTEEILPRELGLEGVLTERGTRHVFYTQPVGTHASMTDVLLRSVEGVVAESGNEMPPLQQTTLVLVGHGTTQNEHSGEALLVQVERLRQMKVYADVLPAFMEQEPLDRDVLRKVKTPNVIVVPFFVSDGLHSREEVPIHMGFVGKDHGWKNPVLLAATPSGPQKLWYARAIGTDPSMAEVILDRAREFGELPMSNHPQNLGEDHFGKAVRTLGEMEFGELLILPNKNLFSVRHRVDRGVPATKLEKLASPESGEALSRYTEEDVYRPLRSAPNLRKGWILENLSYADLALFLNLVLPGARAYWTLEQLGRLRLTTFSETAARQTGIYSSVQQLPAEAVQAITERVCGKGCVRHPRWGLRDSNPEPLVHKKEFGFPNAIPCPEPCCWWIAQAQSA